MRDYIEPNTKLRAKATSEFDKDLFQMNNCVSGKTMKKYQESCGCEASQQPEESIVTQSKSKVQALHDNWGRPCCNPHEAN